MLLEDFECSEWAVTVVAVLLIEFGLTAAAGAMAEGPKETFDSALDSVPEVVFAPAPAPALVTEVVVPRPLMELEFIPPKAASISFSELRRL